jgi:hypothetical protein|eukprot:30409-Pelagococcus_subviridis.AAC.3
MRSYGDQCEKDAPEAVDGDVAFDVVNVRGAVARAGDERRAVARELEAPYPEPPLAVPVVRGFADV